MTTIWIDYAGNAVSRSGRAREVGTEVARKMARVDTEVDTEVDTAIDTEVARSRELFNGETAEDAAKRSSTLSRLTRAVGAEFTRQGKVDLFDHQRPLLHVGAKS